MLAGLAGWFYGLPWYRAQKERRFSHQAEAFMASGDYRKASLSARQALAINPNNVGACRIMAGLAELGRSPVTLVWRRKVAELEPTLDNRLTLASCALRFQAPPFPLATKTLDDIDAAGKQSLNYHLVAAERAIRLNHTPEAELHLREAMRLDPTNHLHPLNLAVLELQSTNAPQAAAARTELASLSADAQYGLVARRSLAADSVNRKDWRAAIDFSKGVLANTNSTFADRLQHLAILRDASDPEFGPFLRALKQGAVTNLAAVADLTGWLNGHGMAPDTSAWVKSLPPATRSQQPLPLLLADSYMLQKDWRTLETWLREQKWEEQDFMRFAILARAFQNDAEPEVAKANWNKAVRAAAEKPELLAALGNLAQGWGWTNQVEALLWEAVRQYPAESWAWQSLERDYYRAGNTAGLLKLYTAALAQHPNEPLAKNNVATVQMLLKADTDKACALAREIYAEHPTNAVIASTYAYSLHLQGKTAEGLNVLSKLKPDDLRQASIAVYYAAMLSAAGQADKAMTYTAYAKAGPLLPEERALLGGTEGR
jgi:tetratricopeptide (TPR) repeat protein